MKIFKYVVLLAAIVLFGFGLYYWLWQNQIDAAALFVAFASMAYSLYLHIAKSDRKE
jgi:hypothetical protein